MPILCEYDDPEIHLHHEVNQVEMINAISPVHIHDSFEIFCFMNGKADYLIESTAYPLQPGSILLMRPGEAHRIDILEKCIYERYTLEFSEKVLDAIDPEHLLLDPFLNRSLGHANLYPASTFPNTAPQHYFENMCMPLEDEGSRRLEILSHLFPLLSMLRRISLRGQSRSGSPYKPGIEEMIRYINEHLSDELSVPQLAERFYMSVAQCERLFKKATGSSLWEYVILKRLVRARQMVRSGIPSTEVFLASGFKDYSTFYRAYRKRFGISPKEDRVAADEGSPANA